MFIVRNALCLLTIGLAACSASQLGVSVDFGVQPESLDGDIPTEAMTCLPCLDPDDCIGGACVQYAGDDYCARACMTDSDCAATESCVLATSGEGMEFSGCEPKNGSCGSNPGCGTCPAGTTCDLVTGECLQSPPLSVDMGIPASGNCGPYVSPNTNSCCMSCQAGAKNCQANGCYGGWWCDSSDCKCQTPPANCSGVATPDMGVVAGGGGDASVPLKGTVGANGGSVSRLYFAVIGDTRPANPDDTANYPTAVIQKIYADVVALNPQFIITTGDYMFSTPGNGSAAAQIKLYSQAAQQFKGPIFAAMGNHECNGYTNSNCSGAPTTNFNSYMGALVTPLGKQVPYYTIPVNDLNNQWTAKFIIAACNDWDATQSNWLQGELAKPTTFTFVVRHEPTGTAGAPCVTAMDKMLATAKYDLFIVGHSHTFAHAQKQVTIGNGGAPLTGNVGFGYATIEQEVNGTFTVNQYDYMSPNPIGTFTAQ